MSPHAPGRLHKLARHNILKGAAKRDETKIQNMRKWQKVGPWKFRVIDFAHPVPIFPWGHHHARDNFFRIFARGLETKTFVSVCFEDCSNFREIRRPIFFQLKNLGLSPHGLQQRKVVFVFLQTLTTTH
jgi:hypothetical protein